MPRRPAGELGSLSLLLTSCESGDTGQTASDQTVTRTTRSKKPGIRITKSDGRVIDITEQRVKEFVPVTYPGAPPGTLDKVKFSDALPRSKGYKRAPTAEELKLLRATPND